MLVRSMGYPRGGSAKELTYPERHPTPVGVTGNIFDTQTLHTPSLPQRSVLVSFCGLSPFVKAHARMRARTRTHAHLHVTVDHAPLHAGAPTARLRSPRFHRLKPSGRLATTLTSYIVASHRLPFLLLLLHHIFGLRNRRGRAQSACVCGSGRLGVCAGD